MYDLERMGVVMLANVYKDITLKKDLRDNIIKLKELIKEQSNLLSFKYMTAGDVSVLTELLEDEDAKNRKNVALILGELGDESLVEVLFAAYKKEEQLFVRSSYLKALSKLDCSSILEELNEERERLVHGDYEQQQLKHIREEISAFNKLLNNCRKNRRHSFKPEGAECEIILTSNEAGIDILAKQFDDCKRLKSGVYIKRCNIAAIFNNRLYNELLLVVGGGKTLEGKPEQVAKALADSNMMNILTGLHKGEFPFRFRVELRGEKDKANEKLFAKKLAAELERLLPDDMVNSISDYEIEIRLVKNMEERYLPLMKLFTITDRRFEYRKHALPVSITPYNAAVVMKLVQKYFREDSRVLDPFCGVGTMLIERKNACEAATLYGIDKFGKAVDMARENAALAKVTVNYINRDYFDFTHEHKFNEIITNMPAESAKYSAQEIKALYRSFFEKSKDILAENSYIFMISDNKAYVQSNVDSMKMYRMVEQICISKKLEKYVFVIEKLRG